MNCSPTTRTSAGRPSTASTSSSTTNAYVHRPTRTIAGIAVQITSSRVLPWIGGPSSPSSPGRMRNFMAENITTTVTPTKTGTEKMIRTSHSVSIGGASSDAETGNQSISSPAMMPSTDATSADADHLAPVGVGVRPLRPRPSTRSPLLKAHGGGILCERADERGAIASAPRTDNSRPCVQRGRE